MISFGCGLLGVVLLIVIAPALHTVARRAAFSGPPLILLVIATIISHLVSLAIGVAMTSQLQYWNVASVFGFGTMLYVFAFGAVYKSVSLEILLDLAQRPGCKRPLAEIVDRQIPDIFRGRTEILVDGDLAERNGASFVVTAAGRRAARRITAIRRAFGIGDTGLYDFATVPPPGETRKP